MSTYNDWMLEFLPIILLVTLLALTFVVCDYFELNTDHYPTVLMMFGLIAIGLVLFGFYQPELVLFGAVAIGIAVYVEFG